MRGSTLGKHECPLMMLHYYCTIRKINQVSILLEKERYKYLKLASSHGLILLADTAADLTLYAYLITN
jgi:hypothetical protein